MKRLLCVEKLPGRREYWWLHWDDDGREKITVEVVQDVEPILDANKREYADAPARFGRRSFHKVATIPATVIEEVCRIKRITFGELMRNKSDRAKSIWNELLNAREFRHLRTRPGRIAVR